MPKTAPDDETKGRLNASLNELLETVCRRLRPGWTIRLAMVGMEDGNGEAGIEFENSFGDDMEHWIEQSESTIWDRLDFSRKPTCSQCGEPATCIGFHERHDEPADCRCGKCCQNTDVDDHGDLACDPLEPMPD